MFDQNDLQNLAAASAQHTMKQIALEECKEAVAEFGEKGEYLAFPANAKVQKLISENKLDGSNPRAVAKAFKEALGEVAESARQTFASDADPWNPHSNDSSVYKNYIAQRHAQTRRTKGME